MDGETRFGDVDCKAGGGEQTERNASRAQRVKKKSLSGDTFKVDIKFSEHCEVLVDQTNF